jgi:hypothetical protein
VDDSDGFNVDSRCDLVIGAHGEDAKLGAFRSRRDWFIIMLDAAEADDIR